VGECVFCEIVAGRSPASIVYADEQVIAFMDTRPVLPGHLLVIPKAHAASLACLEPATGGALFQVAMMLAGALRRSTLRCEGINVYVADGEVAGQDVFHVHLHVLPRFVGDGFGFHFPPGYGQRPSRQVLDEQAAAIREALV
jgi:diadenosine tetraphosphate (Ap4A) HIT family hydrolase